MSTKWMPLYIADYLADTAHLRAAESGAYLHLIMHYWRHGSLPDDDSQLTTIAKMYPDEWSRARVLIQPLFQVGWRHKRIDKELAEAEQKYQRRVAAGRKGGTAPPKQCLSNASALLNQPQPQPQPQEQKIHDGGREARARDLNSFDAFELTLAIGEIAGFPDATHWPPGWLQAPLRVQLMLNQGWKPEIMLATARSVMASKRDGHPNSITYFEKPFAKAHARVEQPLPVVTTIEPQRTSIDGKHRQGRNSSSPITAAIDGYIERFERQARG